MFLSRKILRNQALGLSLQSQGAVRITSSRHSEQMSIQVSIVAGSRFPFNQAKPRRIQLAIPVEWKAAGPATFWAQSSIDAGAYPAHTGQKHRNRSTSIPRRCRKFAWLTSTIRLSKNEPTVSGSTPAWSIRKAKSAGELLNTGRTSMVERLPVNRIELLHGTLDLMILQTLRWGLAERTPGYQDRAEAGAPRRDYR